MGAYVWWTTHNITEVKNSLDSIFIIPIKHMLKFCTANAQSISKYMFDHFEMRNNEIVIKNN